MHKKLLFGLVILVLVALPLLGACAGEAAAPASLKVGYNNGITSVDPTDFFGGAPPGVFEQLVKFDQNEKMIGALAESWSLSADGKTLEFKLRKGVKFSSGDEFKAADVEFSLARNKEKNMPIASQLTQNFDRIEVVDDSTVRFHFPATNIQFLPQTCANMNIISKAYYDKVGEDAYLKNPVGTGPYKITDWKEGQYIDVAYNDKYRGKKPQIQTARFLSARDSSTRVAMLQAGEVDLIQQVPGSNIAALEAAGFKRVDIQQPHVICIIMDLLSPNTPWSNIKVRQAMNYAIDKESLIKTIFGSAAQKASWLLPWELGYDASLNPSYPYDLTKAKTLMKEAGYENGFDLPLAYASWMEWGRDLSDYLASAPKAININVKLTGLNEMPAFMGTIEDLHKAYVTGKPTTPSCFLFDTGWPGNPEVVIDLTNGFYMEKGNTLYDNKEVYALVKQALQTVDNAARGELAKKAYKIINADLPHIPIVLEVQTNMMKSNITYTPDTGSMARGPSNLWELSVK